MPHNIRLFSDVGAKMSMFDNKAKMHKENQMINPFSDWDGSGTRRKLSRDDPDYGKPLEGSKTAERGRQAQLQMISDMVELCDVIFDCGVRSPDGRGAICFGDVFRLYSQINDKCVGLLMRGRKHNILDFEGEMLFQRRDDDKMIELLLPLNTIRFKYGMSERPGCGEVRPDLLEELERQRRDKQPARCRSMEQLGLPPPPLHKSRSMELTREAAKGDAGWLLRPESAGAAARVGHSAENLTQISESDGAVGGAVGVDAGVVFTAAPEAAADGATSGKEAEGSAEGSEREAESDTGGAPVKWEVGDDNDEESTEEKQDSTQAPAPPAWPEVKIVVEEDVDRNTEQTAPESGGKQNENLLMKVNESSDQMSDVASLAPESESEFDFWASTEQDFWEDDKSAMASAVQTPRSGSPERASPASSAEAAPTAEGASDTAPDEQPPSETEGTSESKQHQPEENLPPGDNRDGNEHQAEENDTSRSQSDIKNDNAKEKDSGFSFWDVINENDSPVRSNDDEIKRRISETTSAESETLAPDDSKQEEDRTSSEDQTDNRIPASLNPKDAPDQTSNTTPATNGETFSFWDVSEEENTEPAPVKPKKGFWEDDSDAEPSTTPEPGSAESGGVGDSACEGRVSPAQDGEYEATSAERPEEVRDSRPPPLTVPHITLSDDSELMPAR
ncbi:uncharacterized protein LOC122374741 [Amphibalanus amphitrite]|uniref:uncharacterized protein LOC122374741 n=1 Tax=Amphibalanus amphitrite TaxID=1232801 RepID=UPI001C90E151|nr:uncharacterized protein LOC122374741 [Amphibalanus amphitrite]